MFSTVYHSFLLLFFFRLSFSCMPCNDDNHEDVMLGLSVFKSLFNINTLFAAFLVTK